MRGDPRPSIRESAAWLSVLMTLAVLPTWASAEPRGLSPLTELRADQSCVFGRFRLHVAPLDLRQSAAFGLVLRERTSGAEFNLAFSRTPQTEAFMIPPGRYAVEKMSSTLSAQYRETPLREAGLVFDAMPGHCHYLGDYVALVSVQELQTLYSPGRREMPYSWRLVSAESRYEATRATLDPTRFPVQLLDPTPALSLPTAEKR